jgi:hypothetical protein
MNKFEQDLKQKLKNSNLTQGYYNPSENIKEVEHLIICADDQPILGVGEADDELSLTEARRLVNYPKFKTYVEEALGKKVKHLSLQSKNGKDIEWQSKMLCIVDKDRGEFVDTDNSVGSLHWLLFVDNMGFATALCIDEQVQKIAE